MTAALSDATAWLLVAAVSVGTFGLRISFIALFGRLDEVPPRVQRVLAYVPAAVLTAIVVPGVVFVDGSLALDPGNHRLFAGAFAALVAWRTESMLWTIVSGMAALWALTWLTGGLL